MLGVFEVSTQAYTYACQKGTVRPKNENSTLPCCVIMGYYAIMGSFHLEVNSSELGAFY